MTTAEGLLPAHCVPLPLYGHGGGAAFAFHTLSQVLFLLLLSAEHTLPWDSSHWHLGLGGRLECMLAYRILQFIGAL